MEPNLETVQKQLTIRQFHSKDKNAVWDVSCKALASLGISTVYDPKKHSDFDNIVETYIKQGGDFLVGEVDGKIVTIGGFLCKDENTANIKRMRTLPEYQGQGCGKKLLLALEEKIKAGGFKRIRLGTSTIMPNAIKLYSGMGYQEVERISNSNTRFGPDFAEVLFEKKL